MKIRNLLVLIIIILAGACQQSDDLEKKRSKLKEKKSELNALRVEITALENEIASLDPQFARANRRATLVSTLPVEKKHFVSYLEISGSVESRKNVDVSAEISGTIQGIYADQGQFVKAGQLLVKLEDDVLRRNLKELETSYELAKTMFERQSNLWDKKIGTEVQYLEAKNRKESLENQIATLKTQIDKTTIKAPFNGTVDQMNAKIGMLAQLGAPLLRLVSLENMYIEADVSETYISTFKKGQKALVSLPSLGQEFNSEISSIGQVINPDNRTFTVEVKVPDKSFILKPNQLAVIKLKDYEAESSPVVPTNLIQSDGQGNFVYTVVKEGELFTARKVRITRGRSFQNETVILDGLHGDELLINEGFRDVSDGVNIKFVEGSI